MLDDGIESTYEKKYIAIVLIFSQKHSVVAVIMLHWLKVFV